MVSTNNISYLFDLIGFSLRTFWLNVQDFFNAISGKNVMIAANALVKTGSS